MLVLKVKCLCGVSLMGGDGRDTEGAPPWQGPHDCPGMWMLWDLGQGGGNSLYLSVLCRFKILVCLIILCVNLRKFRTL